jgi:hypothetical protein
VNRNVVGFIFNREVPHFQSPDGGVCRDQDIDHSSCLQQASGFCRKVAWANSWRFLLKTTGQKVPDQGPIGGTLESFQIPAFHVFPPEFNSRGSLLNWGLKTRFFANIFHSKGTWTPE